MTSNGLQGTAIPVRPTSVEEAFLILAEAIPNFEVREAQRLLCDAIHTALSTETALMGQGGCGVGKSFAALLPAIVSGKRVVYSTATKALQDQIAGKDVPFLAGLFQFKFANLKGRSNYVCHARVAELSDDYLKGAVQTAIGTEGFNGEAESIVGLMPQDRAQITISSEECPGKKQCPFGAVCLAEQAKERASKADIVVVNHALLATDAKISAGTGGNVSMIGPYDELIVDEAHELEEYVSNALATTIRRRGIERLATELNNFGSRLGIDATSVYDDLTSAATALFDFIEVGRLRRKMVFDNSIWFENMHAALASSTNWLASVEVADAILGIDPLDRERVRLTKERLRRRAVGLTNAMASIIVDEDSDTVRYVEEEAVGRTRELVKVLKVTPVRISSFLKEMLWERQPNPIKPVLISATLFVGGRPDYLIDRLGLEPSTRFVDAGSPFDFKRQGRLYIPAHMPVPSGKTQQDWQTQSVEEMRLLVRAAKGRSLLLFTSRTEMNRAWDALSRDFEGMGFPCMKQGQAGNKALMDQFKSETASVLFALRSFFTGIDVQGEALTLVVINKLPFPVPTEPVFEARCEEIEAKGGNAFSKMTVPMMTLPLQQASGRLIRTIEDVGVVAILDPRIIEKSYGRTIQNSLAPFPLVKSRAEIESFLSTI